MTVAVGENLSLRNIEGSITEERCCMYKSDVDISGVERIFVGNRGDDCFPNVASSSALLQASLDDGHSENIATDNAFILRWLELEGCSLCRARRLLLDGCGVIIFFIC